MYNDVDNLPVDPIRAQSQDELGNDIPQEIGFWPTIAKPLPILRCVGRVRNGPRQGERCLKWAIAGGSVCASHGAQLPVVKEKAAARVESARMMLLDASEDAVEQVLELMRNASAENVRLKAAESVLDRVGIRGGIEIQADVSLSEANPALTLAERLEKLRKGAEAAQKAIAAEDTARLEAAQAADDEARVIEGEVVSDDSAAD